MFGNVCLWGTRVILQWIMLLLVFFNKIKCYSLEMLKHIFSTQLFKNYTHEIFWVILMVKGFIQFSRSLLQKAISELACTPDIWFIISGKEKGTFRGRQHDFYLHPSPSSQRGLKAGVMTHSNGIYNVRHFLRLWETVKLTLSRALSIVISIINYPNYIFSQSN